MAYSYQFPGVSGRFAGGITNPSMNRLLGRNAGLTKPARVGTSGASTQKPGTLDTLNQYLPDVRAATPSMNRTGQGFVWGQDNVGVWGGGGGAATSGPAQSSGQPDKPRFYDYQDAPDMPTMSGADYVEGAYTGANYTGSDYTSADYTGYDPRSWSDQPDVDTRAIVEASRHFYEDEMAQNMGTAARRFGASGASRSSGAASALGAAERKMFQDVNALGMKYDYDAAQQDAGRSLSAFSDFERRRQQEAARKTGFSQSEADRATNYSQSEAARRTGYDMSEAARRTGYDTSEAARRTGYNVGQQDRTSAYDWQKYSAGLSEAERKQMYDMLKMQYGM